MNPISNRNVEKELARLLDCARHELPRESRRIHMLTIGRNFAAIDYTARNGQRMDKTLSTWRAGASLGGLPLDGLPAVTVEDQDGMGGKLYVNHWPQSLREIRWNTSSRELFHYLRRFSSLKTLCVAEAAGSFHIPQPVLSMLDYLELYDCDVRSLAGAKLSTLRLVRPRHFDQMPSIEYVQEFTGAGLETLEGLRSLPNVERLDVCDCGISDLSPLTVNGEPKNPEYAEFNVGHMRHMRLSHNYISDLSPLEALPKLETLNISDNLVDDITPLGLLRLYALKLSHNPVADLSPLEGQERLETLDIRDTFVRDVAPLATMPKLRELRLTVENLADRRQLEALSHVAYINDMPYEEFLWYYRVGR